MLDAAEFKSMYSIVLYFVISQVLKKGAGHELSELGLGLGWGEEHRCLWRAQSSFFSGEGRSIGWIEAHRSDMMYSATLRTVVYTNLSKIKRKKAGFFKALYWILKH